MDYRMAQLPMSLSEDESHQTRYLSDTLGMAASIGTIELRSLPCNLTRLAHLHCIPCESLLFRSQRLLSAVYCSELREHRTDKPVLGRISCLKACVNNVRGFHGEK